jgi:N4-gp56 family major capsid protein
MAINTFSTNDANAVKVWSKMFEVETLKALEIAPLIGDSPTSIIHRKKDLQKAPGDRIYYNLRMQISGRGVTEGGVLEGNEESLTIYQDSVVVNELYHAVRVPSKDSIDAQRVPWDLMMEAKDALVDWYAKRMSVSFFNAVCGNTTQTDTIYTGFNATTAPSSGRVIRPAGAANDETMTSDLYKMDLRLIDYAKEAAKIASPMIRPVRIDGKDCYVMYLDPRQVTDLRTNTSTGQWLDIVKAYENGFGKDSQIVKGSIGMYNGVILREAPDDTIPLGVNSSTGAAVSNTRRAVLLGAQAAGISFANDGGPNTYKTKTETFDYGREVGIGVGTIFGIKKTRFNSVDYGTIVVPTYAAAHTTTA